MAFQKVGEDELHAGRIITVAKGHFEAPDGEAFEREIVHHPGAVCAVPVLDDGRVVLVRQFRAPVNTEILEVPAGKCDVEGEPPEVTAARELEEEVGLRPAQLDLLCAFNTSPGISDERVWVYLARELEEVEAQGHGPEEEHMTVEHVDLADVPAMVSAGELVDAKTIIGLLLARERVS